MKRDEAAEVKQGRCELTAVEKDVLGEIFKSILESGKTPTTEGLQVTLKKSATEITQIMNRLEQKDLLVRKGETKEITSIYPVSLVPTAHRVVMEDGKSLFAMCAIDALGMLNMFNKNGEIMSRCEWCGDKIAIEIRNGEIVRKPQPNVLIWRPKQRKIPAAEGCCPLVNFFCSREHLKQWEAKNSDLSKKGESVLLEEAYPSIRECWKHYGEAVSVR